jgi:hypothetical protein
MDYFVFMFLSFLAGVGICVGVIGLIDNSQYSKYKNCRYYDQTIERCVNELGWEKK